MTMLASVCNENASEFEGMKARVRLEGDGWGDTFVKVYHEREYVITHLQEGWVALSTTSDSRVDLKFRLPQNPRYSVYVYAVLEVDDINNNI